MSWMRTSRYNGFGSSSSLSESENDSDHDKGSDDEKENSSHQEEELKRKQRLAQDPNAQRLNSILNAANDNDAANQLESSSSSSSSSAAEVEDYEALVSDACAGMCIECADQTAAVFCKQCNDQFCDVCFLAIHKKGNRKKHEKEPLKKESENDAKMDQTTNAHATSANSASSASSAEVPIDSKEAIEMNSEMAVEDQSAHASSSSSSLPADSKKHDEDEEEDNDGLRGPSGGLSSFFNFPTRISFFSSSYYSSNAYRREQISEEQLRAYFKNRDVDPSEELGIRLLEKSFFRLNTGNVEFIPLRLSLEERKKLRLLESAANVSEYTDRVDILESWNSRESKPKKIVFLLKEICAILAGLQVASDYKKGQQMFAEHNFAENAEFFQDIFEIGRRHKVRNPEKLRGAYGKIIHLLMDSQIPQIEELLGFSLVKKLRTVTDLLAQAKNRNDAHHRGHNEENSNEESGNEDEDEGKAKRSSAKVGVADLTSPSALCLLADDLTRIATGDILTVGRSREQINKSIRMKERALEILQKRFHEHFQMSEEDLRLAVLSIGDYHNYLHFNRDPCDQMLEYLKKYYRPDSYDAPIESLAIVGGRNGARLTHSHSNQYAYVAQSLLLWRSIAHNMFALWMLSENDLLDPSNGYRLRNTGQGLNRVQSAPRVSRAMHNILYECQRRLGGWVGSSVIHLGDENVPNALTFIDKYNQVARILSPVVATVNALERLYAQEDLRVYIDHTFGSLLRCRMYILTDFFRHAFDGSGADNFFSAGSCIDGRLTSAWNWCSKLDKKKYHNIFLLAGFHSFDGNDFSS